MADFTWPVSWDTKPSTKPRVKSTTFGDGYEQRMRDGINSLDKEWAVVMSNTPNSEADQIIEFFESRAGVDSFSWIPPLASTEVRVVATEWDRPSAGPGVSTVTATFKRVNEP